MNISGKTRIFRRDFENRPSYSTTISKKNQEGKYENMFIQVQFKQGIELQNNTDINVKNRFASWYESKDGLPKVKFVITEFETEEKNEFEITSDDDLPF